MTLFITAEEINQSGQTTLLDLLQTKRGIEVARNGGPGTLSNVFIRGSNVTQVLLLIDGIRSQSVSQGIPDWSAVPLSQIERIEVVMGPMSSLYGADAIGGVIQIFTKQGVKGDPRLTFSAGAGSYGERVFSAGVSGAVGEQHVVRYALNASTETAKGFSATLPSSSLYNPDKDGYDKQSVSGRFSWEIAKGHELGVSFLNSRNNAQYDSGAGAFDNRAYGELNTYSLYSRNQFAANWISQFRVGRSYTNSRDFSSYGTSIFDSVQDQISWQNDFKIGQDTLQVLAERRKDELRSTEDGLNRNRTNDAFSAAYQARRGAHMLNASVRYDDNSDYGSSTTGSIGYGYVFNPLWRLSTSYGTSFRAPTYADLYVPWGGLVTNTPEKGKNAEIGLHFDDGKNAASIFYYQNRVRDLLLFTTPCPGSGSGSCVTNIQEATLEGVSSSLRTKLSNALSIYGNLDLQSHKNDVTNKYLQRRAKNHGSIGMIYQASRFTTGADVVFSGYRYDNAANTTRLGGYALLNLHATYNLSKDWQLFARWNNVLDKNYELAYGYQTPGSSVFAGVRYGFN